MPRHCSLPIASPRPRSPPGAAAGLEVQSRPLVSPLGQRQGEPEGRPLSHGALDPDSPAMRLDDALADVQADPQADAGAALHRGARDDTETLPDLLLLG